MGDRLPGGGLLFNKVDPEQLKSYVGTYGLKVITLVDGQLYYQREGVSRYALFPMADDMYVLKALHTFRIQFDRDKSGAIVAIRASIWV